MWERVINFAIAHSKEAPKWTWGSERRKRRKPAQGWNEPHPDGMLSPKLSSRNDAAHLFSTIQGRSLSCLEASRGLHVARSPSYAILGWHRPPPFHPATSALQPHWHFSSSQIQPSTYSCFRLLHLPFSLSGTLLPRDSWVHS